MIYHERPNGYVSLQVASDELASDLAFDRALRKVYERNVRFGLSKTQENSAPELLQNDVATEG